MIALGELNLKPEEFGEYTLAEIEAMVDGYRRRYEKLEDLFIVNCALPTYRGAYGKKAPSYRKLTEHRPKKKVPAIDEEQLKHWRNINEVLNHESE